MARQLEKMGHEVHILVAGGQRHGNFTVDGLRIYSNPVGAMNVEYAVRLFKKLQADVCIYHGDFWPYASSMEDAGGEMPLILHSPIDHWPVTEMELKVIRKAKMLITLSRCGVQWVKDGGCENVAYGPHGCDLSIYHPDNFLDARKTLGWPDDKFIYLTVATNKGDRKNHAGMLRAYKSLLKRRPDARDLTLLVIHTYPFRDEVNEEGYDLMNIAISLGLQANVLFPDPLTYLEGISDAQMAMMYQAADVHVLPSKTEGFGLPLIEAGACSLASITTRFASMPELVGNDGWLIDVVDMEVQQLLGYAWQSIPSTAHLSTLLEYVYDHPDELRECGRRMRRKVETGFTWEKAASYWGPILEKAL
jgi:glycosyltransferase involved in cell wall biosynthesis